MPYKFIKTKDPSNPEDIDNVEFEILSNDISLGDLLEVFERFLQASSFYIEPNSLEIKDKDVE